MQAQLRQDLLGQACSQRLVPAPSSSPGSSLQWSSYFSTTWMLQHSCQAMMTCWSELRGGVHGLTADHACRSGRVCTARDAHASLVLAARNGCSWPETACAGNMWLMFVCRDQMFSQGLERVQLHLQDTCQEDGGGGACLICLCHISPTEAVWQCEDSCYAVMHLTCIQVRRPASPHFGATPWITKFAWRRVRCSTHAGVGSVAAGCSGCGSGNSRGCRHQGSCCRVGLSQVQAQLCTSSAAIALPLLLWQAAEP